MTGVATLHVFCGKIASGKSSLAGELATADNAVLVSEDQLLSSLYPGEITDIEAYRKAASRLRKAFAPHLCQLLQAGIDVVLDFQVNTPEARNWTREIIAASGAAHRLHWLRASDAVCKARLARRNASGMHPYQVSEAEYDLFTRHFVPPEPEEGFNLIIHEHA